jgi:hypothetical protein
LESLADEGVRILHPQESVERVWAAIRDARLWKGLAEQPLRRRRLVWHKLPEDSGSYRGTG